MWVGCEIFDLHYTMCVGASSDGIFASQARTSAATGPCPRQPPVVRTPDTCSHAQAQGRGSVTIAGLSYYFSTKYRISDVRSRSTTPSTVSDLNMSFISVHASCMNHEQFTIFFYPSGKKYVK